MPLQTRRIGKCSTGLVYSGKNHGWKRSFPGIFRRHSGNVPFRDEESFCREALRNILFCKGGLFFISLRRERSFSIRECAPSAFSPPNKKIFFSSLSGIDFFLFLLYNFLKETVYLKKESIYQKGL